MPLYENNDKNRNETSDEPIKKNKPYEKKQLIDLFPNANPLALDLLSKMLVFNPEIRINAYDCLNHAYFQHIHDTSYKITSDQKFDWTSLKLSTKQNDLREALYEEVLSIKKFS